MKKFDKGFDGDALDEDGPVDDCDGRRDKHLWMLTVLNRVKH